ncbi:MAG: hypothetical protein GQ535_07295, partial [Rhodobacteraceae bacterium]|nr:hypothetical protein [Paracoccaceae bacterium]
TPQAKQYFIGHLSGKQDSDQEGREYFDSGGSLKPIQQGKCAKKQAIGNKNEDKYGKEFRQVYRPLWFWLRIAHLGQNSSMASDFALRGQLHWLLPPQ